MTLNSQIPYFCRLTITFIYKTSKYPLMNVVFYEQLYPISYGEKLKQVAEQVSQLPEDLVDLIHPRSSERQPKQCS